MDAFRIVIPTHRRVNKQITLRSIPEEIRDDVLLVVSDTSELKELSKLYPNNEIVKAKAPNISKKRHWIMKNVPAEKIFMLDDDMYFFGRCPGTHRRLVKGRWKLIPGKGSEKLLSVKYAKSAALVRMFELISERLDHLAHAGLSSRRGNDCVPESWAANHRMMHAIGYRKDVYLEHKLNFGQVQCREDFNITLHLLKRGYMNHVYFDMCCSPGSYNAPGGASVERTVAISNSEAHKLANIHPGFVNVVRKNYDNVPREEVIIYWKKAYASAK